ncbi:MAG: hypothetical protein IKQ35_00615 [Bacilli bacterium]|nr:hypothetical protein [Bacilli bacterium]
MSTLEEISSKLKSDDMKVFDEGFCELYKNVSSLRYSEIKKYILDLDLSVSELIRFLSIAPTRCEDIVSRTFRLEYLEVLFGEYTEENSEAFFSTLESSSELRREVAKWYAYGGYFEPSELEILLKMKEFQELILNNNEIVVNRFKHDDEFFQILPKEYAYLCALYDTRGNGKNFIHRLYEKHFSDILDENDILELERLHIEIAGRPNPFEIGLDIIMMDYEYCLKQIIEDPTYLQVLKSISSKTGLDLETVMKFASRYDRTSLFKEVYQREDISEDLVDKIRYISSVGKIKDEGLIQDIDNVSIEELKQAEKEDKTNIMHSIMGGPHSRTRENIFDDGYDREIISIDQDGEVERKQIVFTSNHEDGIKELYSSIEFPEDCETAVDRAIYAVTELSTITLIVEREMALSVVPKNMTEAQLSTLTDMFEKANSNGIVAVLSYDSETGEKDFWFEGIGVSPDKVLEQLTEVKTVGRSI